MSAAPCGIPLIELLLFLHDDGVARPRARIAGEPLLLFADPTRTGADRGELPGWNLRPENYGKRKKDLCERQAAGSGEASPHTLGSIREEQAQKSSSMPAYISTQRARVSPSVLDERPVAPGSSERPSEDNEAERHEARHEDGEHLDLGEEIAEGGSRQERAADPPERVRDGKERGSRDEPRRKPFDRVEDTAEEGRRADQEAVDRLAALQV